MYAPAPPAAEEDSPFGGRLERAKWQSRFRAWQKRREMAAKGECLEGMEPDLARVIIRMYADSLDRQDQAEVLRAMAAIAEAFPGTPIAELAQERAEGP